MSLPTALKAAIGDFDYSVEPEPKKDTRLFEAYLVRLPHGPFRALPPDWYFFILRKRAVIGEVTDGELRAELRSAFRALSGAHSVFVSDSPTLQLAGEFDALDAPYFSLDAIDLPGSGQVTSRAPQAPFVLAIKRRIGSTSGLYLEISPYQRGRPVRGWRFFGRARQLKLLVNGNENHILIGPRRIGKTSLMLEATRLLQERGEAAYYVSVQDTTSDREVIQKILQAVSPEDAANVARRAKALGETALTNVLRRLTQRVGRTTILIDEIGNIFEHLGPGEWRNLLGSLRSYTQQGNLRFIVSSFQELQLRQQDDFGGPLVNLGTTLRLNLFDESEIADFVLGPIEFWRPLQSQDKRGLHDQLVKVVGGHPLFLQYYGAAIFEATLDEQADLLSTAKSLLRKNLLGCFLSPVKEVFYQMKHPTQMYLFLKRCKEATEQDIELYKAQFDDDWVDKALRAIGYDSTFVGRRRLIEGLEVHGLTAPVDGRSAEQVVASPLVYLVVRENERSIDNTLAALASDVRTETALWQLRPIQAPP